ncbi:MAG: alpha/beta hydrolase [Saprospiraceae bacterium]|nr:alpha/beta hydrolase [Saprospiraceae bacterium]
MTQKLLSISSAILLLVGVYVVGPKAEYPPFDNKPLSTKLNIKDVDSLVNLQEGRAGKIKPDNQSRIVWIDSTEQTEYSVVYLHGFSASQGEGRPVHEAFSRRYGCNLYLPRLAYHGLDNKDAFADLTPSGLVNSAKEAIQIGKAIGKKVILMSCSTGSTLATYLAANDPDIYALILFSPNIDLYDKRSKLITGPWGKQLLKIIEGGDYHSWDAPKTAEQYWYLRYRNEGILGMKYLLDKTMTNETFEKISQPVWLGYYYKDKNHFDDVVSIDKMKYFFDKIDTPVELKRMKAFSEANSHMMVSDIFSKQIPEIEQDLYQFTEEILNISSK